MAVIVISGATGFVAGEIAGRLGVEHKLIGLSRGAASTPPGFEAVMTYEAFFAHPPEFDVLVNCAVANTNANVSDQEIHAVNVDLALRLAGQAAVSGASVVQLSSIHALDPGNGSAYADSKRQLSTKLAEGAHAHVCEVFLGTVYGDRFAGKLRVLNNLPGGVADIARLVLGAVKPVVNVDALTSLIMDVASGDHPDGPVILTDSLSGNITYRLFRSVLNWSVCLGVLVVFSWFLLLTAIAVRLGSPGPAIFKQDRYGRGGRIFTCYKFRTMKTGTAHVGSHLAPRDSVTRVGRFLRASKVDELPQCVNIVRGEMELLGPRPCLPSQSEVIAERETRGVNDAVPGITGYAQVRKIDMSEPERLAMADAEYLKLRCILLDLRIILQTFGLARGGRR